VRGEIGHPAIHWARPVLILIGGIFFLVGSGFGAYRVSRRHGSSDEGEVTDYAERNGKGGLQYAPVFVFTNQSGERTQMTSSMSSSPRQFHVGGEDSRNLPGHGSILGSGFFL
jgi:hypothetical protein